MQLKYIIRKQERASSKNFNLKRQIEIIKIRIMIDVVETDDLVAFFKWCSTWLILSSLLCSFISDYGITAYLPEYY